MIRINELSKKYGEKLALSIDNYTIPAGEILGLVGNNGAGKTTLFRLILDLTQPTSGVALIDDSPVHKSESWKDITGAFIDRSFLIDYLTAEEYFYFVGRLYGMDKEAVDAQLAHYTDFMKDEVLNQEKYLRSFSAGNAQKVGIIAAMLHEPKLLILDEPFNFLDPSSQSAIKRLLREYNERTSATIVVSSHNLNHTVDISHRIALLEKGSIIRDLKADECNISEELTEYFQV